MYARVLEVEVENHLVAAFDNLHDPEKYAGARNNNRHGKPRCQ